MDDIPHTTWSGSFRVFGVTVKCHMLSNGQRVIEADSMEALIEAMSRPGSTCDANEMEGFSRWQKGIGP